MRYYKTVADVMSRDLIGVERATPFKDLAHLLSARQISAVPVLDDQGRPLGVVSESDLILKEEFSAPERPGRVSLRLRTPRARGAARTAGGIMSAPAITIQEDATLPEAARLMAGRHISRLVVVTPSGHAVGIVTRSDLLEAFLVSDAALRRAVEHDVVTYALWKDPRAIEVKVRDSVVTLTGRLERKSMVAIAEHLARMVDGVVDVTNDLEYAIDDSRPPPRRVRTSNAD